VRNDKPMLLCRQAARTESPAHKARMNTSNCSAVKQRRSSVELNHRPGPQPQPLPRGLFGSQKIRHPRMPYSVGETAPRMYPCRTKVPCAPHTGHTSPGSRLKNRSSSPLSLKNLRIRGRIQPTPPMPRRNQHGAHYSWLQIILQSTALRHSNTTNPSRIHAAKLSDYIQLPIRRHYGTRRGNNTWLLESVHPLGLTEGGSHVGLVVFVAPETHTRALCIVQSPLGLDVVEPGVWEVEQDENLWVIYKKLRARGAGDAPSSTKFLENIECNMPGQNLDLIQPGQHIKYRDPQRALLLARMTKAYEDMLMAQARARFPRGEVPADMVKQIQYASLTMQQVGALLDTGAAFSHSLSRTMKIGGAEMAAFNWGTFRTAFKQHVGTTTRAGQSVQWAKFKGAGRFAQKANKATKALVYLDILLSAYTLADAVAEGENVDRAGMEFGASAGTAGLTFMGSAAAPYMAIPWAGYYMTMELHDAKVELMEAQQALWNSEDAMRRFLLYRDIKKKLQE